VNFFGHAWLAANARPEPAFVFGAMLPDLAAMAGLRIATISHAAAHDGRRFHLATDAAFHRAERRAAGLRRGPARAIGHVGVELLLDGWLAERHGVPAAYAEALLVGPALLPAITFRGAGGAAPLAELCGRILEAAPSPAAWCEPERLAARLARILARRPRLALEARELPAVRSWAQRAPLALAREAPALLDAVRRELAALR
jgi:hypothetical protein